MNDDFNNIASNLMKLKSNETYTLINQYLSDSDFISLNIGYFPIHENIVDSNNIFKYYISFYLKTLENVETRNKKLLDIGCGRGGGLKTYKKYFNLKSIFGIDNNKSCIDFCKSLNLDVDLDVMDINKLSFEENLFDIITLSESLFYSNNQKYLFNNIKKILTQDGTLIIMDSDKVIDFKILNQYFNNIIIEDITQNIIEATSTILDEVKTSRLPDKEFYYILHSAKSNHMEYTLTDEKFLKVICFNKEK